MIGTGCMDKFDLSGRTFDVPFLKPPGQTLEVCPRWGESKERMEVAFAEPLRFKQVGETVDATLYDTYTLRDLHEVNAGVYVIRETLRKGGTGGPAGTASELFVEEGDRKLIQRPAPPKTSPGARALMPGEIVIRPVRSEELSSVNARYAVELPAHKRIRIRLDPFPVEYEFKTIVTHDGSDLAIQIERDSSDRFFETTNAGVYELTVRSGGAARNEPDRYSFYISWGVPVAVSGYLPIVNWHTRSDSSTK